MPLVLISTRALRDHVSTSYGLLRAATGLDQLQDFWPALQRPPSRNEAVRVGFRQQLVGVESRPGVDPRRNRQPPMPAVIARNNAIPKRSG